MNRKELAKQYFIEGYACSQAVALAFSDLVGVDFETLRKISLPMGGGLSRLRLTCGAFSSVAMIIGLLFSKNENTQENKAYIYSIVQELAKRFEKQNKTLSCKQLLINAGVDITVGGNPDQRTEQYYHVRPCENIVYNAASILEDYLYEVGYIK